MDQFEPKLHNEVYPFVHPIKFKASLRGKVTLLTGRSTGTIGRAMAECFSVAGAHLVLTYNRNKPSLDFLNRCRALGAAAATPIHCNVTVGKIDILINNAGVDSIGPMHIKDPATIIKDLAINLHGPLFLMRLVMPGFIQAGRGTIINIASRGGTVDLPFNTTYSTSKAALIRLTSSWQAELQLGGHDGIQLYAIHPGAVPSQMTSAVHPEEIMGAYSHLVKGMAQVLENFKDSPYLSGMVSVALATGIAKDCLNGRYFDVQQDLGDVLAQASALRDHSDLYKMQVAFLGDLPNNGGTENTAPEKAFNFPGY
ncbi:Dehydrogenase/reductase SDR family member 7B [Fusarium odoratissimum]|uniref:Dehydrogenase/reductase SDR family member 7B n=1 Tax=Fusarium oxysporum f. sp. cubense (strain race 4) TaxID=2502994 RepID=N1SAX3_FUSC4|nr:Dehydrogenase/reductase SDR family member 7B [Fusarium odoratissimum]